MPIDVCVDMCTDMRVDMCNEEQKSLLSGRRSCGVRVDGSACTHMDMGMDMCRGMCRCACNHVRDECLSPMLGTYSPALTAHVHGKPTKLQTDGSPVVNAVGSTCSHGFHK